MTEQQSDKQPLLTLDAVAESSKSSAEAEAQPPQSPPKAQASAQLAARKPVGKPKSRMVIDQENLNVSHLVIYYFM